MNLKKLIRKFYWNYRRTFLYPKFYELGENSRLEPNIIWHSAHAMSIGRDVLIRTGCRFEALAVRRHSNTIRIRIGNKTSFQQACHVAAAQEVVIGNGVLVAANVFITDHDHTFDHPTVPPGFLRELRCSPVCIHDGCWLGYGSVVLKGVTIGKRSVIGANAVVTHDIPPYSVAVGVPAKVIYSFKHKIKEM